MRVVYRVLGIAIVVLVAVQAAMIAWADAGMLAWVGSGGVLDQAAMESESLPPFAEAAGFMIHGMNGMMVIPVVALALLVVSFFAKFPGAVRWAVIVVVLVALQITLGMLGHSLAFLALLHGLNALLLAAAAFYAQLRAGRTTPDRPAVAMTERPPARV